MFAKSLLFGAVLAAACVLSAGAAHAQSFLAPYSWYASTPVYSPAYCPNGNCAAVRSNYYAPSSAGYLPPTVGCPNGNCSVGACANGRCALGCANGVCSSSARPLNYAPARPVYPSYYRTPVTSNPGWNATSFTGYSAPWSNGYTPRSNHMFNSTNSPFYP